MSDHLLLLQSMTAFIAFIAGLFALGFDRTAWRAFFVALLTSVTLGVVNGVLSWAALGNVGRQLALGLGIVAAYVLFRAAHAGVELSERYDEDWQQRYERDLAFVLIPLFAGFNSVIAWKASMPAVVIAVMALLSLAVGAEAFRTYRTHEHGGGPRSIFR